MKIGSSLEVMEEINRRLPEIEVRGEQIDALNAIEANEQAGENRCLVVMPPGLGKTIVMAADTRRRLLRKPGSRGIFFCDNNDILNQAHGLFKKIVGPEFSYGLFSGDEREYDELSVLFGSFQAMREWRFGFLQDEFGFGIVDESHHGMAPTYRPTLDYFSFDHLLGVTATPDRLDIRDIRDIFGPERYSLTLEEAIARQLLAAVDYYVITDKLAETGVVTDDEGQGYSLHDFDRTVFAPQRDVEIAGIAKRYAQKLKDPQTLGFCKSIAQAEVYAQLFDNAAAFHSGLSRDDQRKILMRYKSCELKALFTVHKFDEGIDVPEANQILFLSATGSKRIYLQQLGRGLRKTKTKNRVQVLDFVNNAERLLMVDRLWRDIAALAGGESKDEEMLEINISNVHFNESSRLALRILNTISGNVYRPEQTVPQDSLLARKLARDLQMTLPALLALAASLKIEPSIFPTHQGPDLAYFLVDQVERLRLANERLFR